jgi:tRNA(adenine34) deaminase
MLAQDLFWMQRALQNAKLAQEKGEVPVGAVLVHDNQMVAEGYNQPISGLDPTLHAEIVVLRAGAQKQNNYRLPGCTLYVTLEPCAMCAGAISHARISRLVYGALDPKTGVIDSQLQLLRQPVSLFSIQTQGGILAEECGHVLRTFFQEKRKKN